MADLLTATALRFDFRDPSLVVDAADGAVSGRWERSGLGQSLYGADGCLLYQLQRRAIPGKRFRHAWSFLAQPAGPAAAPVEGWIGRIKAPKDDGRNVRRRTAYELDDKLVAVELMTRGPLELDFIDPETQGTFAYVSVVPLAGVREHLRHEVPYEWRVEFPRPVAPVLRCAVFAGMYATYRSEVSNASVG